MKKTKLNLKNVKNALSRAELKNIMAGSGGGGCRSYLNPCFNDGHLQCCPGAICFFGGPNQGIGYCSE